ncbi:MAG: hypoxanthine phosphoribosyltransferase [Candidatus Cloacimonetes bacterium]|nr:hypoxanthine phosphoribosyltransferase [Candidatus Cloacimonadota bacterium]
MIQDISEILFDEVTIQQKIQELGAQISHDYQGKRPVLICILKGAVVFLADLMRSITLQVEIDFMSVSSYGRSTKSSGTVQIRKDIDTDLTGKPVIIVEDIVDTGLTLHYLRDYILSHKPESIAIAALLDKAEARKIELPVEYCGFTIPNAFVVGYGLDYAEKYRNLPYIGILKEEIYK